MISKGNNKTAAEKRWHETVMGWAYDSQWVYETFNGHFFKLAVFELDHIIGAQTKRKPHGKVGEWAVMPLPYELHNILAGGKLNRTLNPANFRKTFGHEKQLFKEMVEAMKQDGIEIPFSDEILTAIVEG